MDDIIENAKVIENDVEAIENNCNKIIIIQYMKH